MRAACYPAHHHKELKLEKISTQHPVESAWERLVKLIVSVWPASEPVAGIGVAAPGPVDPYQGIVLSAPNIPAWVNLPLASLLHERFGVPVSVGNDANMAALGEWKYGAGKGHRHLVYLTVSTGIGGGVIMDNRLLLGYHGLAAELGHITVEPGGPLCSCGQRGHLEALASGPAIARWVQAEIAQGAVSTLSTENPFTTKQIAEAARGGDDLAIRAFGRAGRGGPGRVEGEGFEPSKAKPADLQSAPFDRSGTPPGPASSRPARRLVPPTDDAPRALRRGVNCVSSCDLRFGLRELTKGLEPLTC